MPTTHEAQVRLHDTGDLIAAIPHLLGFHPADSLVISAHSGTRQNKVALCLRADIPPPDLYWSLAEQLKIPVLRSNAIGISVFVVSAGTPNADMPLPHSGLVDAVHQVFASVGVPVYHALWMPEIRKNAGWRCYGSWECHGRIPDPMTSTLAAASAASGVITFKSRAELRASLEPGDRRPLASRAERIAGALRHRSDEARARQVLSDAIAAVRDRRLVLDEDKIVSLAVALSQHRVRDGCLHAEIASLGKQVEELWTDLVRAVPAPYRAEPAFLLGVTAFLRGDGAMAGVAVEAAFDADPDHSGARILREAMDWGLPPEAVAECIAQAFASLADHPDDSHVGRDG